MKEDPKAERRNAILGRSATKEEAARLIAQMEAQAEIAPQIELTPENWLAQFGKDGEVNTPIGKVKMGDNQYRKLAQQGRDGKLGMIKPTLENPDVIVEDKGQTKDEHNTERPWSYVFIKAFIGENGQRKYLFTSVTVRKNKREVSISNQEKSEKRISNLLQQGKIGWINQKHQSASETQNGKSVSLGDSRTATKADNNTAPLGINSPNVLTDKGTLLLEEKQTEWNAKATTYLF